MCVHPLQLLEEAQVQLRVRRTIGQQQGLYLLARLLVHLLDLRKLLGSNEARTLIALCSAFLCVSQSRRVHEPPFTSQGTVFDRILFELSSRYAFETSDMDIAAAVVVDQCKSSPRQRGRGRRLGPRAPVRCSASGRLPPNVPLRLAGRVWFML